MSENAASTTPNPNPTKSTGSTSAKSGALPKGNPAFRALGLPNFRLRLPSRNWMIFWTIVGSWTGALVYDRYQKKKIQKKWCTLVEHIAKEQIPNNTLPRRVTIYLAAPPGDGIRSAREHFVEYVKPVLVAGALDWDVVEGRREGEVRVGIADKVRRLRKKSGEASTTPLEMDATLALENVRERVGVQEWPGLKGDIIIGRHTWKEYIRGLHEGWLGPLDQPHDLQNTTDNFVSPQLAAGSDLPEPSLQANGQSDSNSIPDVLGDAAEEDKKTPTEKDDQKNKEKDKEAEKPSKPLVKPPYNTPASYDSSPLPTCIPQQLTPTAPIPFPHLLGFLNTPIRMYRFLTRRYLAEDVGRQTAAAVLLWNREFKRESSTSNSTTSTIDDITPYQVSEIWEQAGVLKKEEAEWSKSVLKRRAEDAEKTWTDPMVVDGRIAERMRLFLLDATNEERARRIADGASGIPGRVGEPDEAGPYEQKSQ